MVTNPAPQTLSLDIVTQEQLDEVIKHHRTFLKGVRGGARAVLQFKNLSGLDFRKADLSQADFTGSLLQGANLSHGIFRGASFFTCDLRKALLIKGNFSRADFRGACVSGADLTGADLEKADLREGKVMERGAHGVLQDKNWEEGAQNRRKTIFTGAKLCDTNLSGSRASTADFTDADLSGVVVKDADFNGVNLEGANLSQADFTGSNLRNSNLTASIMTGTILLMTETGGSNLQDAMQDESIGKTFENPSQELPVLLESHTKWVATAGKDGQRMDISGFDMRNIAELRLYSLTAIKAIGTSFLKQNLEDSHLQSALLDQSDFRDCNLKKSDLRGSSLKNVLLTRADLSNAQLSALKFYHADGTEWLQRTDLRGANLRYTIFRDADLSDSLLAGADLSYAMFINCDLRRADLTDAIFDQTSIEDSLLQGTTIYHLN